MTTIQETYTVAGVEAAYGIALTARDKTLVTLRDELYMHSWKTMAGDLSDRQKSRPYIWKIQDPIAQDLKRIPQLQALEGEIGENLATVITAIEEAGEELPEPSKKVLSRV